MFKKVSFVETKVFGIIRKSMSKYMTLLPVKCEMSGFCPKELLEERTEESASHHWTVIICFARQCAQNDAGEARR